MKNFLAALSIVTVTALGAAIPSDADGATAKATATAEVINPAAIDLTEILSPPSKDRGALPPPENVKQPQPQVKIRTVDGIPFVTIDYE